MAQGIGGMGLIGDVIVDMMGLKRAAKQDQLAADLARQAAANQRAATARTVDRAEAVPEVDPNQPARRGQIVDIIA